MSSHHIKPLVNPSVLIEQRPLLVQKLVLENVLPGLRKYLSSDEADRVDAPGVRGNKVSALLSCLERKTSMNSFKAFNAFIQLLAGTQPQLFTALVGRAPTASEADLCIKDISQSLRTEIRQKGHKKDSPLDDEIDFDKQYVQLQIVRDGTDKAYSSSHRGQLPHEYELYLKEIEVGRRDVSVYEVLDGRTQETQKVLTTGRAGVGKTTTLQRLAREWALDKWATGFTLLFLLQLRVLIHTTTQVRAIELLSLYGLFHIAEADIQCSLNSWLTNGANRVILLIDGIDEISQFASRMMHCSKISNLNQKAHPVDLCINFLQGNLLPGCTIICTSRPFSGLRQLTFTNSFEIIGLTQKQIEEFVTRKHPVSAQRIISELQRNPILGSVCGITFYCMALSNILNDGVTILDEDVQTYTRLTAFILVQLVLRQLSDWPFLMEVGAYFPKLAILAHMGIFQTHGFEDLSKLVFSEKDLRKAELTAGDLELIRKVGILHIREFNTGHRKSITAEFLHLSMQELLAVTQLVLNPSPSIDLVQRVLSDGQFNMAQLYLFGTQYDASSQWINDVRDAVSLSHEHSNTVTMKTEMQNYLQNLCEDCKNSTQKKLLICQLVHEGHLDNEAKQVISQVVPGGVLCIKGTPMTAIDLRAVAFVCKHVDELKSIILHYVHTDDTFINIMISLILKKCRSTLQTLQLTSNRISTAGMSAIIEWLKFDNSLHTLNVSGNSINSEGAKTLAEGLRHNNSLRTLIVSGSNIDSEGVESLAEALRHNNSLHTLNVSVNSIVGGIALGEALRHNKSLDTLIVSGNRIGSKGAEALGEGLRHNKSLHTLNVSNNSIDSEGGVALGEALRHNNSLHTLNVSWNSIGSKGAKALGEGLRHNKSLHTLNVSNNSIDSEGRIALGEGLRHNNSLHTLVVIHNSIGSKGAESLAEGLKHNTSLQTLDVSYNSIGREGGVALGEALRHNNSLRTLNVSYNSIGGEGVLALAEGLTSNRTVNSVFLLNNGLADDDITSVLRLCQHITDLHVFSFF